MKEITDVVSSDDSETQETVLKWLVDQDLFEDEELINSLKDLGQFRDLVQEAIITA